MIKDFPFAMEGDKVLVTENKIRKLLKTSCSHVKKFTLRDKRMCGCHACTIFEDIFTCKCAWTKKFIQQSKDEIKNKLSGTEKRKKQHDLTAYVSKVCLDKEGTKLKNVDAWDAACELGCEPIKIGDKYYEPFTCVLGQCNDCKGKWKHRVHKMELECDEIISYVVWGTHHKCSYHGDYKMGIKNGEYYCKECSSMADEKKRKLKGGSPSIKKMKLRIKRSEKMKDFVKHGGTYKD